MQGLNSIKKFKKISNQIKLKDKEFYCASTGVIGERFPIEKIEKYQT